MRDYRTVIVSIGLITSGIVAGVVAKAADESSQNWAGDLGTYPAIWVLALAVIARFSTSGAFAAFTSSMFFLAVCAGYYGWSWLVLGFGFDRYFILWAGLAIVAVPLIAVIARWAFVTDSAIAGLMIASVAAAALADRLVWQLWWAWVLDAAPDGFPLRPFQAAFGVAVALTVIALLPVHRSTRIWGMAFLVPAAIVASAAIDHVMGTLLRFV